MVKSLYCTLSVCLCHIVHRLIPKLVPCRLHWKNDTTLIIGWEYCVKVIYICIHIMYAYTFLCLHIIICTSWYWYVMNVLLECFSMHYNSDQIYMHRFVLWRRHFQWLLIHLILRMLHPLHQDIWKLVCNAHLNPVCFMAVMCNWVVLNSLCMLLNIMHEYEVCCNSKDDIGLS